VGKKSNNLLYIMVIVGILVSGIVITAIIGAVKNNQSSPTDIRARAGVVNIVKLTGTISDIDFSAGKLTVANTELSQETRSGPVTNYGTWSVTVPQTFNIATAQIGQNVTFVVDSNSFDVASHKVTASQVTIKK
jgi:hypothetical protein